LHALRNVGNRQGRHAFDDQQRRQFLEENFFGTPLGHVSPLAFECEKQDW
jgi:hypothetical protein